MPASEIWLDRVEARLKSELEQGDMPFLGLYTGLFDENTRLYFHEKILGQTTPIKSFIRGLFKWPAVFATYLTVHVVEGYGRSGTAEVYPFIEDALGTSSSALDQRLRVELWNAYRKACIRLGLSVVPEGSSSRPYVDEYLRQAGVPIKYLAQLAVKLENHAARLGIPEADDPESISGWQEQLRGYLGSPLSKTIPRAIETDETAYFTTAYLRVRDFDSEDECQNDAESAIYQALAGSARTGHARVAQIPELQWRNGSMGVQIPSGEGIEWRIRTELQEIGGAVDINVVAEDERQFVPLPEGFPLKVSVSGPNASFEFPAWKDDKDNRVLLVDRLGHIRGRSSLGSDSLQVLPGSYTLVTRWSPIEESLDALAVSFEPTIYESILALGSGETVALQRGPASLEIMGKSVASVEWQGESKTGVLGREMLAGVGLRVAGTIPSEIESAAPGMFEVAITARDIERQVDMPIVLDEDQTFSVALGEMVSEWPFGLIRVGVVIRRRDIPNRAFARMSGLVWNGLVSTDGIHFKCVSPVAFEQSNIDRARCENVRYDTDGLTFRDDEQRYFRTVFELTRNETVSFTWLVPGLFLSMVEFNGENLKERPLAKEAVIQVKPSSRLALKVYSTLEGVLKLGDYQKAVSASSMSGMQMYLAPLLEHITAEDRKLKFIGATGIPIPLLEIVSPHQLSQVTTNRSADNYRVTFELTDDIDELAIESIEMLSGRRESIDIRVDVLESATGRAMEKIWASSQGKVQAGPKSIKRIEINWNIGDWEIGAYVFRIRAKVAERWGELVNARGDAFVGSTIVSAAGDEPLSSLEQYSTAELLDIFRRMTEFLLECYSEESWDDVKWIATTWRGVSGRLDVADLQVLIRLSILALRRAPEHSPASWAPINCVGAARLDVFAQPRVMYQRLPSGDLKGLGILRSLGAFANSDKENFSRNDLFAPLAILGFDNGPLVAVGAANRLQSFSLEKFSQTGTYAGESERHRIRRREEWVPSPGLFLGARHYWWAVNRLETKFLEGFAGNEHRRGNALRLASRLSATPWRVDLPPNASQLLEHKLSLGLLCPSSVEDEVTQNEENITSLIDLLSATAFACRFSARQQGFLDSFRESLADAIDTDSEKLQIYLGYAIYVGMDVFLYYLLLWEFVLSRDFDEVSAVV